ncbi:zf-PARP-domain-containing protein [Dendrothele bispora CBS 962.96]|uniref:Zf-PARP-domain-containing protein n=1 Tax=Dendrothele bispora (strain CBS 962.96) TaxID=1314807 RepID=A0A4S8MVF0_DENBC|nr:zf-PARP-domain-containing protein [Dendrothele bispora CBS 962.96]
MPSGYRFDYAPSNRAKCKGPKPCNGTTLPKGTLRHATMADFQGKPTSHYRHWGCVTKKIIENMKAQFPNADEVDGFEDLKPEDQDRIRKAWEDGEVAEEDIPESAKKTGAGEEEEEEDEEKPKKKKAPAKKKTEDGEEKPKKARAPRKVRAHC